MYLHAVGKKQTCLFLDVLDDDPDAPVDGDSGDGEAESQEAVEDLELQRVRVFRSNGRVQAKITGEK